MAENVKGGYKMYDSAAVFLLDGKSQRESEEQQEQREAEQQELY